MFLIISQFGQYYLQHWSIPDQKEIQDTIVVSFRTISNMYIKDIRVILPAIEYKQGTFLTQVYVHSLTLFCSFLKHFTVE